MPKKKSVNKKSVSKSSVSKKSSGNHVHKKSEVSMGLAVAALLLNIIVLPGLGSLVAGKTKEGIWQVVLTLVGAILYIVVIGIPILLAAWIWGLVSGINLIRSVKNG